MASTISPPSCSESTADGPVLNLMNKRLRALRKKYNRILQMEASVAQGKTLNKEQEEVLRSRPGVVALIDEYEKLRSPLAAAVQEEILLAGVPASGPTLDNPNPTPETAEEDGSSSIDSAVEGLLALLYFGSLFDVKPQSEFTSMMLMRTHERVCCLTYDYVTDDATELLGETDLDMISALGGMVTSRPLYSGISHRSALQGCLQHAKLWLHGAHQTIAEDSSVTYASLREKLKKIMDSDYYTATPEMKAPDDVAAAVGKYSAACQVLVSEADEEETPHIQSDVVQTDYNEQEEEEEDILAFEVGPDQSAPACDLQKDEADDSDPTGDFNAPPHDRQQSAEEEEHDQNDHEQKDQQYIPRRAYPNNQRGGRGGVGAGINRRGYPNARGRIGRGGGGGYQNGRNQYYDPGYHPRSYYNPRGRGGGSGASGHGPSNVELGASA